MKDIMKLELFQLRKSVLFWIMFALSFLLPLFSILMVLAIVGIVYLDLIVSMGAPISMIKDLLRAIPLTPMYLQSMVGISSTACIFALITSGVVLSKEFTGGTMRNVILANKSRAAMYFSYLFIALFIGVIFFFSNFTAIMLVAAPIFGFGSITLKQIGATVFSSLGIGLLAVCFVQSCVCMFLFCVRRQWATIVFPLLFILLLPNIFSLLLLTATVVLAIAGIPVSEHLVYWTPFANLSSFDPTQLNGEAIAAIVTYYVIFTAVFIISGYFTFKKADLK